MHNSKNIQNEPNFSTLTGIIDRFYSIPYKQFQQELDEWFRNGLAKKGVDFNYLFNNGAKHLSAILDQLVTPIYSSAEQRDYQQNGGASDV